MTLEPGDTQPLAYDLADGTWTGHPDLSQPTALAAIYTVERSPEALANQLWTGSRVSAAVALGPSGEPQHARAPEEP